MNRTLKYVMGALGLWLIVAVSVFGSRTALWLAFGTAIAIALVAATDIVVGIRRETALARVATAATGALAIFLVVASLVFEGASMSWLMVVGGGVVELMALGTLGLQGRPVATKVTARPEPREAREAA